MTNRREPNSPRLTRRLKPAANDPNLRTMQVIVPHNFCPLTNPQPYQRDRDKPRQGVVTNTLNSFRNGAVGFIEWLDVSLRIISACADYIDRRCRVGE
jgi:hypothetical protein